MINFSIVIPLYNNATYIQRAIDSVLAQTIPDFECIIIDDGSTDNSAQIVKQNKDPRIKLVQQLNAGVSMARNKGISLSQFDYIGFLDADDTWENYFLEEISQLISDFPHAGLFATSYKIIGPNKKIRNANIKHIPPVPWKGIIPNFLKSMSMGNPPICASACCAPKTLLKATGGFPKNIHLNEDTFLWIKISLTYPIAYSPRVCATYFRNNTGSLCKTALPNSSEVPYALLLNEAISKGKLSGSAVIDAQELIAKYTYVNSVRFLLANQTREARKWVAKAHSQRIIVNMKRFIVLILSFLPYDLIKIIGYRLWGIKK